MRHFYRRAKFFRVLTYRSHERLIAQLFFALWFLRDARIPRLTLASKSLVLQSHMHRFGSNIAISNRSRLKTYCFVTGFTRGVSHHSFLFSRHALQIKLGEGAIAGYRKC